MADEERDEYSEIIDDNQPEEKEIKSTPKIKEESDGGQPRLVTEDDIERLGLPKGYLGKDYYKTLENAYTNIRHFETKNAMEVSKLNEKISELEKNLTKGEKKEVEKKVEEQLPDYELEMGKLADKLESLVDEDGYVIDKAGYSRVQKEMAKFQKNYLDMRDKKFREEIQSTQKEKIEETDKRVQQIEANEMLAKLYDELSEGLSKVYPDKEITQEMIDDVLKEWSEDEDNKGKVYEGNHEKMARDILRYHKSQLYDKPETPEDKVLKAHKKQVEQLKNSSKTFVRSATSARKQKEDKEDDEDEYSEIIKEAEQEADWIKK